MLFVTQNPLSVDVYEPAPLQPKHGVPTPQEIVTFNFLGGVVLWLDIISCITTGKSPHILPSMNIPTAARAFTEMQTIMGCKNWVMFQISRIASLHARRSASCMTEYSEIDVEMRLEIDDILAQLELGTTPEGAMSCGNMNGINPTSEQLLSPYCTAISSTIQITRVFAFAGFVYLKLVLLGFHEEALCLTTTMTRAMETLRNDTPRHLLSAMICPLYVLGCAARDEDKPFFRDALSSAPLLDPSLAHRAKILPLLEKIWIMRDSSPNGVSWSDMLQQSDGSLLLF